MKAWLKIFAFLYALPIFSLIFFQYAPDLENRLVKNQFLESFKKNSKTSVEMKTQQIEYINSLNFYKICSGQVSDSQLLVKELQIQDVCESFDRFEWIQKLSLLLFTLITSLLFLSWLLGTLANRSRAYLVNCFKFGWSISSAFSLMILLGQTLVTVFSTYYLTVLLLNRYYPKLLLIIAVGGAWAFFKITKLLISKIPIESQENSAESITPQQAPVLWQTVQEIAKKIGTEQPKNILVGLSTLFYVTEFPVRHTAGTTSGRTLFLSEPMMKQMPLDEISAIIGHEMGHFYGADTALTRDLTPLLIKSDGTMNLLSQAGWIGAPAMHVMGVFSYFFEKAISGFRRQRELLADAVGVSVTSEKIVALALCRYSYVSEVWLESLNLQVLKKISKEQAETEAFKNVSTNEAFWSEMANKKTPHPFDSHPPLNMRIEKLGQSLQALKIEAMQSVKSVAYDVLIGSAVLLEQAKQEHQGLVEMAQQRSELISASVEASEDQKILLEKHFPTLVLEFKKNQVWKGLLIYLFLTLILSLAFLLAVPGLIFKMLGVLFLLIGFYFIYDYWQDWKDQTMTLTSDSILFKSWKEPLNFKDIKEMYVMNQNGISNLYFELYSKRPAIAKRPIVPWPRRTFVIDISGLPPNPTEAAQKIFKYYLREI